MRPKFWGSLVLIVCLCITVSPTTSASAADEVFVVSASATGDANFMTSTVSNGQATFSLQAAFLQTNGTGSNIIEPFKNSYGNALGDFDKDGDLDYITGIGFGPFGGGHIYILEKSDSDDPNYDPAKPFAAPQIAAAWGAEGGLMPGDMAVADFDEDEDKNPDFVMAFIGSAATGLYLGDGHLGFSSVILPGTAPVSSVGIDTADFNNDGHADFVVAPNSDEPFFINLGDGHGKFTTYRVPTIDSGSLWGVAAADFNGDGAVDIAAAYDGYLYIYKGVKDAEGNVDGHTFVFVDGYEFEMNQSALDNYDFNGDGKQDLVAANYGDNPAGVAVLLNNAPYGENDEFSFSFTYAGTYGGGFTSARTSVAAPPEQLKSSNIAPVAVIEPTFLEITAGDEIVFDGSNSYDEDGEIVSWEWDFGDADPSAEAEVEPQIPGDKPSHIYYQTGTYSVTLTVTDDKGATNTIQAEVSVLPVTVTVKFSPHELNHHSRDKWLTATLRLPENLDVADVEPSSLFIVTEDSKTIFADANSHHSFFSKCLHRIQSKMNVMTVKFNRQAVVGAIETPSDATVLTLKGKVGYKKGTLEFQGAGTIQTLEKSKKRGWFNKILSKCFSKKSKTYAKRR